MEGIYLSLYWYLKKFKKIILLIIIYEFMLIINYILCIVFKIDINILGFWDIEYLEDEM